ncbi:hypothetical protein BD289DRAFT_405150 [Coniella lustricola]|uniref:protein-tyrosine-phosphatase n=1 Tax=Coniella lustricola TaxID=2025994 RepID=A0A2T3AEW5_9PEZI|nr:hypothetical protein BD289DRAFT_405150 [Coniella lustricola]
MYTTTARRLYEDQIPSLMSVFDLDQAMHDQDQDTVTVVDAKMMDLDSACSPKLGSNPSTLLQPPSIAANHQHRESTSTHASESADSSPTTTVSCTDSSSLSDPSPSSSPDSPVNLVPLNAFPGTTFGALPSMASLTVSEHTPRLVRPMTSPAPRRRNMKGLSIQPPFLGSGASQEQASEPSSPSFIKPKIPAMKRKPSNLSLKTNSDDLAGRATLDIPQSPSLPALAQRRALKHSTSSPHMLSGLKSATFGPAGGMGFPTVFERNESGLSSFLRRNSKTPSSTSTSEAIIEEDSPIRSQMANRSAFDTEPYHEKESNEDQKSPGYPEGPIAIYADNVYLYLEPTADEARKFDVVINVAREVANPFQHPVNTRDDPMTDMSPVPDTAATDTSFATAFEFQPDDSTPTTPKAAFSPKEPEYIHIPWDHNSDIGKDLMHLCETIERKTLAGKKVLVHCQQGASRSASLIIAYGLYQNPDLSVNDAYYAAQAKSRWISPNMRLMYCLQDFQKQVGKKRAAPNSAYKPRSGRSPSKHRMTLSVDAIEVPKEPQTAPLPDENGSSRPTQPEQSPLRARGNSSPDPFAISPGPSSAPSAFSWEQKEDEADPGRFGRFNRSVIYTTPSPVAESPEYGFPRSTFPPFPKPPPSPGFAPSLSEAFPRPPPSPAEAPKHVHAVSTKPEATPLLSPRAETMTNNPIHTSFAEFAGMRFVEIPPTPSDQYATQKSSTQDLFSPRNSEFPRDTFSSFGRPRQVSDPRSPPTKGEAPIVRSIDEMI